MPSHTAVFEYRLPSLLIVSELVGPRLVIPGTGDWIQFPEHPASGPVADPPMPFHTSDRISGWIEGKENRAVLAVRVDCVAVGIPVEMPADLLDRPREVWTPDTEGQHIHRILTTRLPAAQEIMRTLHEWLRTESPHWMSTQAGDPGLHPFAVGLYDESMTRLDFGWLRGGEVEITKSSDALDRDQADQLLHRVADGQQPPLARVFLADAAAADDQKHKVVLAAIGVEIAVKSKLQERASSTQKVLVGLLLGRAREFSSAAAQLFDKPCLAVLGASLKEDDPDLLKLVARLFEDRNRVAHGSMEKLRSLADLNAEVQAATAVCDWLDAL